MSTRIQAFSAGLYILMWCSVCGPMGVSPTPENAFKIGGEHLDEHRAKDTQEQP